MKRIVLLPVVGAVAAAGALVGAGSAAATTPSPKHCEQKPWESTVQDRPYRFGKQDIGGVYLWHNKAGFQVRVTHKRHDRRVFKGAITADTAIFNVKRVRKEREDRIWLSADRKTLYFKLKNHGGIDGITFRTACASSLTVSDLKVGRSPLPAERVYLGKWRTKPATVPFTVKRLP